MHIEDFAQNRPRFFALFSAAFFLATVLYLLVQIAPHTGLRSLYTLDDPYIHLALAQNIHHGLYGLNAGEPASPSSSVLWPFLLSLFAPLPFFTAVPLLINIAAGSVAAYTFGALLDRWRHRTQTVLPAIPGMLLCATFIFAANLPGLTFAGMEHVLQIMLTTGVAAGIIIALDDEPVPFYAIACAILGPAIRYENFSLVVAMVIVLLSQRRLRATIATIFASAILPAAFSLYLIHLGLSPLPISVQTKSATFDGHFIPSHTALGFLVGIYYKVLYIPDFLPLLLLALVLGVLSYRTRKSRRESVAFAAAAIAILLHVCVGPVGWFYRYQLYIFCFGVMIVTIAIIRMEKRISASLLLAAAALMINMLPGTLMVPAAVADIYRQQYQMYHFVRSVQGNYAANDIGWVSIDKDPQQYLVDLGGLASAEVANAKVKDAALLSRLSQKHNVEFAVIYPEWFTSIPADWKPLARLCTHGRKTTVASSCVVFFATPLGNQSVLEEKLHALQQRIPSVDTLEMHPKIANQLK